MNRLPVYLLLDTSGSMQGEPMESLKVGLETMLAALRADPFALESVQIAIITFDRKARLLVPLTGLDEFVLPAISVPKSGPTHTGAALELLLKIMDRDLQAPGGRRQGNLKPVLFIMTDGKPSDTSLYNEMCSILPREQFSCIIPCACGMKAREEPLKLLADKVYSIQNMAQADFRNFFQWLSTSICAGSQNAENFADSDLPSPPDEIIII